MLTDASGNKIYENEGEFEDAAVAWARRRGWYVRKFKAPGRRSLPDRIFVRGRCVVFIEFKHLAKEPTELQYEELAAIRKAGGLAVWVDRWDDFAGVLKTCEAFGGLYR